MCAAWSAVLYCLQALPDGQLVVSAGEDGCVLLWDPARGAWLKRSDGHTAAVRFMRVVADGKSVVTGSGDRQVGLVQSKPAENKRHARACAPVKACTAAVLLAQRSAQCRRGRCGV